jgi:hypothetical protein
MSCGMRNSEENAMKPAGMPITVVEIEVKT